MNLALQPTRDPGLNRFLIASLGIHVAVALVSSILDRPGFVPPATIEIELAPLGERPDTALLEPAARQAPAPVPAAPAPKQVAPPAEPKAAPIPKPVPKPTVSDRKTRPVPAAKPAPTPKAVEPTPKPAPPVPAPAAKPAAETKPQAESTPAAPPRNTLADVRKLLKSKAPAGSPTGSSYALPSNVKGRLYFSQIVAAVGAVWQAPPSSGQLEVKVEVLIAADGRLLQQAIHTSSGDPLFDRSAMSALSAADIPGPPADFKTPLRLILRLLPPEN